MDNVPDASAAFITACARSRSLMSLAGVPSHDAAGLPIEMLYLRMCDEDSRQRVKPTTTAGVSCISFVGKAVGVMYRALLRARGRRRA